MTDLAGWLEHNFDALVEAAAAQLSPNEALKSQVVESVEAFFDGFLRSLKRNDPTPLRTILIDWVEARSAPTEEEPTGRLVTVLATLKQVTWLRMQSDTAPEVALDLLIQADMLFTQAMIYLADLEAEALLGDMREQLHEARLHVQRLDKSKSDFIAVAAHELKTPLTIIEGYTTMLVNDGALSASAPNTLSMLEGVDGGVKRLREIITDLIDVSLIELNLLKLRYQPVWLHQLLDSLERTMQPLMQRRSLEFAVQRNTVPAQPTYADGERLLQALHKVVANAVKYTPDGGIIVISARELPGFTDVMVTDTGIGIEPTNLSHIFDTFSALGDISLHSSGKTKFKGGGPGLGLPIAKGIIEAHGGTIWAQSSGYDEKTCPGSTFHIMIPMRDDPPDGETPLMQLKNNVIS